MILIFPEQRFFIFHVLFYSFSCRYAQQVWTTIREQKELNLPSQREMLAAFRCDEFIMATMHSFHEQHAQRLASAAKSALVSDFGTQAKQVVSSTLTAFEESTAGYEIHVRLLPHR